MVCAAVAGALAAGAAGALTVPPTPTATGSPRPQPTGDLGTKMVAGRVFDAAGGPPAPIAGATVHYVLLQRFGGTIDGQVTTDAAGGFAFTLSLHDTDDVVINVFADGFYTGHRSYSGVELWLAASPIEVPLDRLARQPVVFSGLIYDDSHGTSAPIAGAEVRYDYASAFFPAATGVVQSGADGRYRLELPFGALDLTDSLRLTVEAPGFAPQGADPYIQAVPADIVIDFALVPSGGVIAIDPETRTVQCFGSFDVAVRNVGTPEQGILTITAIGLTHGYSQGDYGTGFSWDLSRITLPAYLASGEQLSFPVSFGGAQSRLHLSVRSGALNSAFGTYYGRVNGCGVPTPTATPLPLCAGDCSGDGVVSVDDLVLGVLIALQSRPLAQCPAMHAGDLSARVDIADLILAVRSALDGCPGAGR